jgi:hypothetical protein
MDWLRNRGLPTKRCTDSNAYEIEREVSLKGRAITPTRKGDLTKTTGEDLESIKQ